MSLHFFHSVCFQDLQLYFKGMLGHSVESDSLQQPPSLFCKWDFPGKNTDMCCHFLLQGIFPTQGSNLNIGVGCHAFLHGIFPTQGTLVFPAWQVWILCHLGSSLLHWQMNSLPPNHLGNPSLLAICPQEKIMLLNLCGWGGSKTILKAAFLWFLYPSPSSSPQSGY